MLKIWKPVPKDVHTELIQHKRSWMLKRGMVRGNLSVDSYQQRLNGSCPLMPEEVRSLSLLCVYIFIVLFAFYINLTSSSVANLGKGLNKLKLLFF